MKEFNPTEYKNLYAKSNYKRYSLQVRKDNTKVIDQLAKQPSINAYIISLIEQDIGK